MRQFLAILYRELRTCLLSPTSYVILFVFLLLNGISFQFFLIYFRGNLEAVFSNFYGGYIFWFLMLLVPPLLTMRSFAEEKSSGTYELLVTTGVGESKLVTAKTLVAFLYFAFLWVALFPILWMAGSYGDPEWGVLVACHLGIALLGLLFSSVGVFASTLTSNQLVSSVLGVIFNLFLFFTSFFANLFPAGDLKVRYFQFIGPLHHFSTDFLHGVFDLRYVILYGSLAIAFQFLAVKSLERRRWW